MPEQESVLDRERAAVQELVTIMEVLSLVEGSRGVTLLPSEKAAIVGALLVRGDFRPPWLETHHDADGSSVLPPTVEGQDMPADPLCTAHVASWLGSGLPPSERVCGHAEAAHVKSSIGAKCVACVGAKSLGMFHSFQVAHDA